MANTKISQLTTAGTLAGSEVLPVVQSGTTKKVTRDAFVTGGLADQTFILDQYNSGYYQSLGTVDLSDQGGDIVAPYYHLPTGWSLNVGATQLLIPDGYYIVNTYFYQEDGLANDLLSLDSQAANIYPDMTVGSGRGYWYTFKGRSDMREASSCWSGRIYTPTDDPAYFSWSWGGISTATIVYAQIFVTRLGD